MHVNPEPQIPNPKHQMNIAGFVHVEAVDTLTSKIKGPTLLSLSHSNQRSLPLVPLSLCPSVAPPLCLSDYNYPRLVHSTCITQVSLSTANQPPTLDSPEPKVALPLFCHLWCLFFLSCHESTAPSQHETQSPLGLACTLYPDPQRLP